MKSSFLRYWNCTLDNSERDNSDLKKKSWRYFIKLTIRFRTCGITISCYVNEIIIIIKKQ